MFRIRRDTPSPISSPRLTPSFPHSALQCQMIPTSYLLKILLKIRVNKQENDSLRVLLVTLRWCPQNVSLWDLIQQLLNYLSLDYSYTSRILQSVQSSLSRVVYQKGPFLPYSPKLERVDAKTLLSSLRLSLKLPAIEKRQLCIPFIFDPQMDSIDKICDSFENTCCGIVSNGKLHMEEIRSWKKQLRDCLDYLVATERGSKI